jgi:hypothetical protein
MQLVISYTVLVDEDSYFLLGCDTKISEEHTVIIFTSTLKREAVCSSESLWPSTGLHHRKPPKFSWANYKGKDIPGLNYLSTMP